MDPDPASFRAAAATAAHVTRMAISVLAGTWAGSWVDGRFDTAPAGFLLGLGVGSAAGLLSLYHAFRESQPDDERNEADPP